MDYWSNATVKAKNLQPEKTLGINGRKKEQDA